MTTSLPSRSFFVVDGLVHSRPLRPPGPDVVLRDGRRLRPDIVLAATGFRRGLEPLVGHLDVLDPAGLPRGGSGKPTPGAPGLWFIGYRTAIDGNLRQHPIEARHIARAIASARSKAHSDRRPDPVRVDARTTKLKAVV